MRARALIRFILPVLGACSGSNAELPVEALPQDPPPDISRIMSAAEAASLAGTRGVQVRAEGGGAGYTLFAPLNDMAVYLVDLDGEVVHSWRTDSAPGACCYLLEDGSLLRAGREDDDPHFRGGGIGGRIQKLAPDGSVLWSYPLADETQQQHHDLEPLPNGNVLVIAWERKSQAEALARGRRPEAVGAAGFWPDKVLEIRPTPPAGGEIVWEWHAWDHLVQDLDARKPNYGVIAEHPERMDINADVVPADEVSQEEREEALARAAEIAALGYAGGEEDPQGDPQGDPEGDPQGDEDAPPSSDLDKSGDWLHTNAVDYCAAYDLLVLSSPELCEVWVIDHSTTTAEAATSSGGRWGQGGDVLWRWGHPAMYAAGTKADQRLFYQHNPTWLASDGDLRLLVFNNGGQRDGGQSNGEQSNGANYSSVDELVLPFDPEEGFVREAGRAWGPTEPAWSYASPDTFFSAFISGAQRLPNGNTLVCSGAAGRVFEVTPEGTIVWDFLNPLGGTVTPPDHAGKAPPLALFRAERYAPDHPGVRALLSRTPHAK